MVSVKWLVVNYRKYWSCKRHYIFQSLWIVATMQKKVFIHLYAFQIKTLFSVLIKTYRCNHLLNNLPRQLTYIFFFLLFHWKNEEENDLKLFSILKVNH